MRLRKAISPILSVIILLGITILGGSIVYGLQEEVMNAGLFILELRVIDLKLEKDSQSSCYLQGEFYNSGTDLIKKINLKTTLDNGDDFIRTINGLGEGLSPGNSTEYFEFIQSSNFECGNFTKQNTYSVFVNASSSESTFSAIKAVKVENVTLS